MINKNNKPTLIITTSLLVLTVFCTNLKSQIKIMPVGDSITRGQGSGNELGFRDDLKICLDNNDIDFQYEGSIGEAPFSGWFFDGAKTSEFYSGGTCDIGIELALYKPDMLLIHLGTNEVHRNEPMGPYGENGVFYDTPSGRLAQLVEYVLDWKNGTNGSFLQYAIVSKIIPRADCLDNVQEFNAEVERIFNDSEQDRIPSIPPGSIRLADHHNGFDINWLVDGKHPNDTGYAHMSDVYCEAILNLQNNPEDSLEFTLLTAGEIVEDNENSYGCNWIDYDNDDYLDAFVVNSGQNSLYRNNGDSTFSKINSGNIVGVDEPSRSSTWGDYDNDGDADVFISNTDANNSLYLNNNNGIFTKITSGVIVADGGASRGCSWGDYDNDGDLDLFVADRGENNFLYTNNGDGEFIKVTAGAIVTDGGESFGSAWSDYDNDGDLDLFVANYGTNFLYINNGNGTFSKVTSGAIVNDEGNSLGASWGDYNNDGYPDLFVANTDGNNFLYNNNSDGTFTKITTGEIVNDGGTSKGSCWGDYDNDGDLDLFVADNGVNSLYSNNGDGTFKKNLSGNFNNNANSLGCAWGDYDNDGDLDLFVVNYDAANSLYRNDGNTNHWVNIKCIGASSNVSGVGVKVRVTAEINGNPVRQLREISGQTGHGGQNSLNTEFGLGDAVSIDSIKVEWPSGLVQVWENVQVNQFITVTEGSGAVPVELAAFTVKVKGSVAFLNWTTESEKNNFGFEVQRLTPSRDGKDLIGHDWETIGFVPGKGSCTVLGEYSFFDDNVSTPGQYFYRLKQMDLNGEFQYSQELQAIFHAPSCYRLSQNYPNPFSDSSSLGGKGKTTIIFELPEQALAIIRIFNIYGQEIRRLVQNNFAAGVHRIEWNGRDDTGIPVPAGVYYYHMSCGNFVETKKLVVLR